MRSSLIAEIKKTAIRRRVFQQTGIVDVSGRQRVKPHSRARSRIREKT